MNSFEKKRLCSVSVDLDEIPNYLQIHGLEKSDVPKTLVYDLALDRLDTFAREEKLPLTLFAIGRDLDRPESARALRRMKERGHEMANHTLDHLYDLTRRDRASIREQIEGGMDAIERATGERPIGFRAPGYTITDEVFDVLQELGVRYDSSVFPCPPYYFAKATALAAIRAMGRRSRSILDSPNVLLAPTRPYRIGRPYWKKGDGIVEMPIQVTRGLRVHFIGTTITLAGPRGARALAKMCVGEPLVNLELHGIDVLDGADGLEPLARHQPDVRVSLARKMDALRAVTSVLRDAGYAFVTLREAAENFV